MSNPALRPGRIERALRGGVIAYITLLVAVPLVGLLAFGLADGPVALVERLGAPVARAALWLTLWTAMLVGVIDSLGKVYFPELAYQVRWKDPPR